MTEAARPDETLPQIYTSRQVFGFDVIDHLVPRQAGEAMLLEARKQRAKVLAEVERRVPDHVIDPRAVLVEIGVQYLVD